LRPGDAQRNIPCVKCPKCDGAALLPLELGDILLDRCEDCAGIWFDHGELEAVIGAGGAARLDGLGADGEGDHEETHGGPCPRCDVEMQPVAASQDPNRPVPVDRCPSCMGLWLDRKRLKDIEDARLLLTVRELFLGGELDEQIVADLPEDERDILGAALELLRSHSQKTAMLAYLERESGGLESGSCQPEDE